MKDPYFNVYASDFLGGVIDLKGDEIGAYWVVILLMHDRSGPIPDDAVWIARRAGLSRQRWYVIRKRLIDLGKLVAKSGMIANPRALRDIDKRVRLSKIRQSAAMARWHAEEMPELPFADDDGHNDKKPQKTAKPDDANASGDNPAQLTIMTPVMTPPKIEKQGGSCRDNLKHQKRQKTAKRTNANASKDSRAHVRTRTSTINNTNGRTSEPSPARTRTRARPTKSKSPTIDDLMRMVFDASGFHPTSEGHVAKARTFVEKWQRLGIDFDTIVLPCIQRTIATASDKTTGSLLRFDRLILAEAAAAAALQANPSAERPTTMTITLGPDDDDPRMVEIRNDLRRNIGGRTYEGWLGPCRFGCTGNTLQVDAPSQFLADWILDHFSDRLRSMAKIHGFTLVEISKGEPVAADP